MDPELTVFFRSRTPDFAQPVTWRGGEHRFQLRGYFTPDAPPDRFVLAGRAIVLDGPRVLVVHTPDGEHILPGGRREAGETAIEAVHREVAEETGWSIENLRPLGVLHLRYETPEPVNVGRVIYPDFLWHVFVGHATGYDAASLQSSGYELGANFQPITEVLAQGLEPYQTALLAATARGAARQRHPE